MKRNALLLCMAIAGLLIIIGFVLHTVTWAVGPVIRQNPAIGMRTVVPAEQFKLVQNNLATRNINLVDLTRPISTINFDKPTVDLDLLKQSRIQSSIYGTLTLEANKRNFGITVDIPDDRISELPSSLSSRVTKGYVLDVGKMAGLSDRDRKLVMGQLISNSKTEFLNPLGDTDKPKVDKSNWGQAEKNTRKRLEEATVSGADAGDSDGGRGNGDDITGGGGDKKKDDDVGKTRPDPPPPPPPPSPPPFPRIFMLPWNCELGDADRCGELNSLGLPMSWLIVDLRSERAMVQDKLRVLMLNPNREEIKPILLKVKGIDDSIRSNLEVLQNGAKRNNKLQEDIKKRGLDREKDYPEADAITEQMNRGIDGLQKDSQELEEMLKQV